MASNQLSNKRSKSDGKHSLTGQRSDSTSQRQRLASNERREDEDEEEVAGYLEQGASQFREMTRDHQGTAVMVALAAGLGIGLAVGRALATPSRPRTWRERLNAEGIGRHMLDRLEGMIPDALADYIRK
jgi:hypothetical protein